MSDQDVIDAEDLKGMSVTDLKKLARSRVGDQLAKHGLEKLIAQYLFGYRRDPKHPGTMEIFFRFPDQMGGQLPDDDCGLEAIEGFLGFARSYCMMAGSPPADPEEPS